MGDNRVKYTDNKSRTTQAFWLAVANLLSMSATLLIAAVLSRFMPPADYGTYRQVIFIYYTLLMLFSWGMPRSFSYFLAKVPVEEGRWIVCRLNSVLLCLASLFSAILFFGATMIASALGNEALAPNLRYFAVTPMLLMPLLGVEGILTVYKRTRLVAGYVAMSRLLMIAGAVLPVIMFGATVTGAVIGFVSASFLTCLLGWRLMFIPFRGVVSVKSKLTLREVADFVMPIFTSSIYGFVIASSSQFFVSRFLGVEAFAVFANGYRELPFAGMIIGATAGVLLPEFTRLAHGEDGIDSNAIIKIWRSVVVKSTSLIYPLSVFACFFAGEIMTLLYGGGYQEAAPLFVMITIVNLTRVVPYGAVMFALGGGRAFAKAHLLTAVLIVALDFACVQFFPSVLALAAIATGCTVFCLMLLLFGIARSLSASIRSFIPAGVMLKIFAASLAACVATRLAGAVTGLSFHGIAGLTVAVLVFVAVYLPLAMWLKPAYVWFMDIFRNFAGRVVPKGIRRNLV